MKYFIKQHLLCEFFLGEFMKKMNLLTFSLLLSAQSLIAAPRTRDVFLVEKSSVKTYGTCLENNSYCRKIGGLQNEFLALKSEDEKVIANRAFLAAREVYKLRVALKKTTNSDLSELTQVIEHYLTYDISSLVEQILKVNAESITKHRSHLNKQIDLLADSLMNRKAINSSIDVDVDVDVEEEDAMIFTEEDAEDFDQADDESSVSSSDIGAIEVKEDDTLVIY